MNNKIKIIIADDHPIFRNGLRSIIERDIAFEILAEANNGNEAIDLILEHNPDIAILDINMPCKTGLEVAREIHNRKIKCDVVILTMYKDEEYFDEAMELSVKAYLLKDSISDEIIDCLKAVSQDDIFVSPEISKHLISRKKRKTKFIESHTGVDLLSPTEKHILKLLAENKTSQQISDELFISIRTVQNHRNNICIKLELKGYNKLLQFAIEHKSLLSS